MFGEMGKNDPLKRLLEELQQDDSVIRAQLNDQRLMKLAEYDATHGYMKMKVTPDELQGHFYELKRLVMGGDMTLKALEDDVYTRWGIQEPARELATSHATNSAPVITGFNVGAIEVADIPDDSPKNH